MLRLVLFLVINFGALALGGIFTSKGVGSDWYDGLVKAPWTPPGWFFGFAWTSIMICFSIYLFHLWPKTENKGLLIFLFSIQWVLNVAWNPAFFYYHSVLFSLGIIVCLTLLLAFFVYHYHRMMRIKTLLILPYFFWLMVATSLNAYIYIKN